LSALRNENNHWMPISSLTCLIVAIISGSVCTISAKYGGHARPQHSRQERLRQPHRGRRRGHAPQPGTPLPPFFTTEVESRGVAETEVLYRAKRHQPILEVHHRLCPEIGHAANLSDILGGHPGAVTGPDDIACAHLGVGVIGISACASGTKPKVASGTVIRAAFNRANLISVPKVNAVARCRSGPVFSSRGLAVRRRELR